MGLLCAKRSLTIHGTARVSGLRCEGVEAECTAELLEVCPDAVPPTERVMWELRVAQAPDVGSEGNGHMLAGSSS